MLAIINTRLIAAFDSPDLVYGGIIGIVLAIVGVVIRSKMKAASQRAEADSIVQEARREAETLLKAAEVDAKAEALKRQEEFAKETAIVRAEWPEGLA